ncbi:single-stranded DNA-binding protein [Mammaliicoccus vitulinus]|uniref:Single-stranded DNA-binding protein n=3 Tax=Mammaliicoccus vitulinus TaxID=71237 RepID=A0ABX7HE76_9STAP|nr:single-stranded DNA-binding protein [Mammaliicoccus vitulinus]MBM6629162.1 single-stranded DNA-binding protein [Mammaliicoccus vitulinus]MBO3076240.1 single-stranded DNA-binding protein [Mammaliicoccus vitulinus]MEB7657073.1 single-stranded DNA-binding protein [Mammaliicoccus vitulinus]PNZ40651.1 single-stranded DNA-binding protein [Mammaliicoccus vitulinus]PTI90588.1 single-stranded DNA-binding protein [Mammaliicoccus vitulinus]
MLNKSVLVGRLTKDPAYFKKGDIMISTFCLAVERGYKTKDGNIAVDFIVCKAFGKLAYNIHEYTKKGQLVALTGQIQSRAYIKDDKKQYITEIICETIKFLNMPASSKSIIPQSKEEISELISESAESYSNDLSSNFNKEKLRAKNTAKDNNENNINDEIYNQYSNVVKVMKEIEDSSNNENPSSNPKVPTS